jgi:hypothetical protein
MPGGLLVPRGSQVTVALHSLMINPEYWKVRVFAPLNPSVTDSLLHRTHSRLTLSAGVQKQCEGVTSTRIFRLLQVRVLG